MKITRRTRFHDACIEDIGQLRVLRFERNRQSSMYLDAPFDTDFDYPGYLHLTLAVQPEATRTLVIGLGGGTIIKRMWRDYPEMSLDVVELDPDVIDICRTYFALPDDARIRVHLGDGREFLEESDATYDIVIVDAFDDDVVPKTLTTEEFMRTARERLAPDGVIAFNTIGWLTGERSRNFRSLYRTLTNVWRHVWVFVVNEAVATEGNNIIMLATDAPLSPDELHRRIEDRVGGRVTVPQFDSYGGALHTVPIRTGDVPLLTDPPWRRRRR